MLAAVRSYCDRHHPAPSFDPERPSVPVSGRVYDADDMESLVDAALDFWLTTGRFADEFERRFASRMGRRFATLVNSGSSANLCMVSALTSSRLGDRALRPGDEVITAAAGFPTTVAPIIQNGLVPVWVDSDVGTYNALADQVEAAVGPRTRAILLAHTLGNPFNLGAIARTASEKGLWLLEDTCDAIGATYAGRAVGTWGDLASVSFYPAHHITMGEGGCVLSSSHVLKKLVESFRDWGRDCWCDPGKENTCGKRFGHQFGGLPAGYDHKYTYSHLGYNLKATDMQAAVGVSQLSKLDRFIEVRRANFGLLSSLLVDLEDVLVLPSPTPGADPSWFGFPLTVRRDAPLTRNEVVRGLEVSGVGTRLLFGGNLTRQPAFLGSPGRVPFPLSGADEIMHNTFWIGLFPGLSATHLEFASQQLHALLRR
ncbi:MAG: lipopolysaccharide biosynthesis protein RfbH [Actinomycetota bacterium]|nr:lipopolysaccharide biosynthesis protein RfbH [Actinomycetota bacterium]